MYTYNEPTLINSEKTNRHNKLLPVYKYGEKIHTCFLSALNSPPPILLDIPIYTPDTSCDSLT